MFKLHTFCRACGLGKPAIPTLKHSTAAGPQGEHTQLIEAFDLGITPLANDFCDAIQERAGYAPLKLMWCPRCTLGQLSVVVSPQILYRQYSYVTSHSETMRRHFAALSEDLSKECGNNFVVEIGSNDGTLLEFFNNYGFKTVLGVDPAENLCDIALKRGVNVRNEFFSESTAQDIVSDSGNPDLVIARHVFCHIDDWQATIRALELLSGPNTVIAIEVPGLWHTLRNVEWDQIYHEHLSYLSVNAMRAALHGSMLHIHSVKSYPIHGGAIVILLRRNDSGIEPRDTTEQTITLHDLKFFEYQSKQQIRSLRETLDHLVLSGKTVVGYGASAKCAQWLQACNLTKNHIKWVCDSTPQKQYKCMPGTNIPIVDDGALTRELPDYAVCFAWNFADEIIAKEQIFRSKGGRWIVPHGEIRIL